MKGSRRTAPFLPSRRTTMLMDYPSRQSSLLPFPRASHPVLLVCVYYYSHQRACTVSRHCPCQLSDSIFAVWGGTCLKERRIRRPRRTKNCGTERTIRSLSLTVKFATLRERSGAMKSERCSGKMGSQKSYSRSRKVSTSGLITAGWCTGTLF